MSAPLKYATAGLLIVTAVVALSWSFLDAGGRQGVLVAGGIALIVQVGAFWTLLGLRHRMNGFLAVWAGGTVLRMLVVAGAAVVAVRTQMDGAIPMLLSLAGFFFVLLLLESVYFRSEPGKVT